MAGLLCKTLMISYKTTHTLFIESSSYIPCSLPKEAENLCPTETCTWMFIAALFTIAKNLEAITMSFCR